MRGLGRQGDMQRKFDPHGERRVNCMTNVRASSFLQGFGTALRVSAALSLCAALVACSAHEQRGEQRAVELDAGGDAGRALEPDTGPPRETAKPPPGIATSDREDAGPSVPVVDAGATGDLMDASAPVPEALPISMICGDGIRDPELEECDDGAGFDADSCSAFCRTRSQFVVNVTEPVFEVTQLEVEQVQPDVERYLGNGRHPIAGADTGFAIAYVEPGFGAPELGLTLFEPQGARLASARLRAIGLQHGAVTFSDPVVAAADGGRYFLSWTDFGLDGDELGIGLAALDRVAGDVELVDAVVANEGVEFSQHSPDILWTADGLVVVWLDDGDATAPDLRVRLYDVNLAPLSDEFTLSGSSKHEGRPALAHFGDGWAVAWRESQLDGTEVIQVRSGAPGSQWWRDSSGYSWTVPVQAPSFSEDLPALVALSTDHLLLTFTEGTDASGDGLYSVPRLRGALLDVSAPGVGASFEIPPLMAPYASRDDLSQSHPNALRVENRVYVSWRSPPTDISGDSLGDEVWLKELLFDPSQVGTGDAVTAFDLSQVEHPLPSDPPEQAGDQRSPALAAIADSTLPGGAIAAVWDDPGASLHGEPGDPRAPPPTVSYSVIPSPIVNLLPTQTCTSGSPCDQGKGHCSADSECGEGLSCLEVGPRFGLGRQINICVPSRCGNGVTDGNETATDCGGECGDCPICPGENAEPSDGYCSALCPCGSSVGDCDTDEQCLVGLVCGVDNGEEFGLIANREVCMPAHCADGMQNFGETSMDCGGPCPACLGGVP